MLAVYKMRKRGSANLSAIDRAASLYEYPISAPVSIPVDTGGEAKCKRRLSPLIPRSRHRFGDRACPGSRMKMINQLLAGVHIAVAVQALPLAQAEGFDLKTVYDIVRVSAGNSWMFENRGAHSVARDYAPLLSVDIFVKDLSIRPSQPMGSCDWAR